MKTGLEILKEAGTTAGEIADILGKGHPPFEEGEAVQCDHVSCRDCWLSWLTTGKPPVVKENFRRPVRGKSQKSPKV